MCRAFIRLYASLLACLVLIACSAETPSSTPQPTAKSDIPNQSLQLAIESAFQQTDPAARRAAVLGAVGRFLQDAAAHELSDHEASQSLTDFAFGSKHLTVNDPAFVRRKGNLAVVGLPDGMGLYLYDVVARDAAPLLISQWTVGLNTINVVWRENELGAAYDTLGADGTLRSHFALLTEETGTWSLSWHSDDAPDWWFNSRNASLDIAPDLSSISVIGDSASTTTAFDEGPDAPHRQFRLAWVRKLNIFQLAASPDGYESREVWMWASAAPSPYATLVEFIERLQRRNLDGLPNLVVGTHLIDDANAFGFYLTGVTYKVILTETDRIILQGRQGTFEFRFTPPQTDADPWKISQIKPTAVP